MCGESGLRSQASQSQRLEDPILPAVGDELEVSGLAGRLGCPVGAAEGDNEAF